MKCYNVELFGLLSTQITMGAPCNNSKYCSAGKRNKNCGKVFVCVENRDPFSRCFCLAARISTNHSLLTSPWRHHSCARNCSVMAGHLQLAVACFLADIDHNYFSQKPLFAAREITPVKEGSQRHDAGACQPGLVVIILQRGIIRACHSHGFAD